MVAGRGKSNQSYLARDLASHADSLGSVEGGQLDEHSGYAEVAPKVERTPEERGVGGSIPPFGTGRISLFASIVDVGTTV